MIVYRERSTSQHYRSDHTTKIMALIVYRERSTHQRYRSDHTTKIMALIVYRERSTHQHYRSDHTTKIMARKYIHSEYEIAGKNFLLTSNRMQKKAHTPDLI